VTVNGAPSTFAEVYCKLRDSKIKEVPFFATGKYETDEGEIQVSCDWPLQSILRDLVDLTSKNINPYQVKWFYYGHDWSRDGDESYQFFAVLGEKIVRETCIFSYMDPLVLKPDKDDDPIWRSHTHFDEAWETYCYQKFYGETLTGKLMVLRPDEPILYHYQRPQARDYLREIQVATQLKMYWLLWVFLPLLVAVVFPSLRTYMTIVAAVLGVNFLFVCWQTRKHGNVNDS
jgi:hypothetical protein